MQSVNENDVPMGPPEIVDAKEIGEKFFDMMRAKPQPDHVDLFLKGSRRDLEARVIELEKKVELLMEGLGADELRKRAAEMGIEVIDNMPEEL